jgi:CRISPR-associated protein Csm1
MMDETTLKIAMASFLHDIGKFAGKDVFKMTSDEFAQKAADFLPVKDGKYSHAHALYTAEFMSRYMNILPAEFDRPWGEGDGLLKLAASHHSPSSPMEWIIAEADRISSGMDREQFNAYENAAVPVADFEKTRMAPVLECLDYDGEADFSTSEKFQYAYPLAPMTAENIFPKPKKDVFPQDKSEAKKEYADLFDQFVNGLKRAPHRDHILLWFEHFESLLMRYTSQMPAARVGNVIPDVSLYDHLRTTAAIASALFVYHKSTDSLTEKGVKNEDSMKFLLINGDFHGIQNFIFTGYGDTRKYRSKLLRGRSFYVSMMTEMAAHLLCSKIGLPFTSVILNAGGKFTLLAPNTADAANALDHVRRLIDDWFVKMTYGESGISFSFIEASPADFKSGRLPELQDRMNREMALKKLNRIDLDRYGGVIDNYFDSPGAGLCPFCGKRPISNKGHMPGGQMACTLCRDHVFLGENLVKKQIIAVLNIQNDSGSPGLSEPLFGEFQLIFPEGDMASSARKGDLLKYWSLSLDDASGSPACTALRFFNGFVPVYTAKDMEDKRLHKTKGGHELEEEIRENAPKTMNHIAAYALNQKSEGGYSGVEALGVLKADVDHLGLLMACGLKDNLYSISRIATLSRQLNNFFTVYLSWLLESRPEFQNIYTVFAGGDDLFLIGPWNRMVDFAPILKEKFTEYVCRNPKITISAGISLHKSHTPVNIMAEAAEEALKKSKTSDRNRMTLFDETLEWENIAKVYGIKSTLLKWLDEKFISRTMLYRLNAFIDMADREARTVSGSSIHIRDMSCTKWRALLAYAVERNVLKTPVPGEREERINEVRNLAAEWLATWRGGLRIPLWYIQYNRR